MYYALKANPLVPILSEVARTTCGFEAASWGEIELLLGIGVEPERIIFGTAVKAAHDVRRGGCGGNRSLRSRFG